MKAETKQHGGLHRLGMTASALAMATVVASPALPRDLPLMGSTEATRILNVCATERAPLVERDKDYEALGRQQFFTAAKTGVAAGAKVMFTAFVGNLVQGGTGSSGNPGLLSQDNLGKALSLKVPGLASTPPTNDQAGAKNDQLKAWAAIAILVAVTSTIDAYVRIKQEQSGGDLRKAADAIEQDAAGQLPVGRLTAEESTRLSECRTRQVSDYRERLASASNDKERKALKRERGLLVDALNKDVDVTGDVIGQQSKLAQTFTQGRAMAENTSEAQVLGGQKPAYAETASTEKLTLPPPPASVASAVPAPAQTVLVTLRSTQVRSAPSATGGVVMTFSPGREVRPKSRSAADGSWWEIDVGGTPAYVRGADLGEPNAAPKPAAAAPGGKKGGKKGPSGPPPLAAPANIRAYNQSIIAAREGGAGRLKSLITDIQS